jgi:hypothetical protein
MEYIEAQSGFDARKAFSLKHGEPVTDCMSRRDDLGPPQYSATAVNQAIKASNRAGRKISGKEARMIHALLKGRNRA